MSSSQKYVNGGLDWADILNIKDYKEFPILLLRRLSPKDAEHCLTKINLIE